MSPTGHDVPLDVRALKGPQPMSDRMYAPSTKDDPQFFSCRRSLNVPPVLHCSRECVCLLCLLCLSVVSQSLTKHLALAGEHAETIHARTLVDRRQSTAIVVLS